jgi:hypothetical protein
LSGELLNRATSPARIDGQSETVSCWTMGKDCYKNRCHWRLRGLKDDNPYYPMKLILFLNLIFQSLIKSKK